MAVVDDGVNDGVDRTAFTAGDRVLLSGELSPCRTLPGPNNLLTNMYLGIVAFSIFSVIYM